MFCCIISHVSLDCIYAIAGFGLAVWIGFSLFAAIGLGNLGQAEGGEDMY